ncbi:hypothetical protein, partial [Desulfoprunum sp.]|uniref:hypothetical protein n=1 Tax=Desulfoprunum sp. TaxID=2020866 RepID=UPI003C735E8F
LCPTGNNELRHLDLPPGLSPFHAPSSRPAPAVISTGPRCHLDLPPLSSRPAPAAISTGHRCHLEPQGEISCSGQRL